MKNFDIFIWASDYEEFTGEGLLARCFVENYFFDSNLKIKILSNYGIYFFKNRSVIGKPINENFPNSGELPQGQSRAKQKE